MAIRSRLRRCHAGSGVAIEELQKENEILAKMYDKANEGLTEARAAQRWISVDDAMPELIPCNAGTAYSEAVVVLTSGRKILTAVFDGEDFICDWQFWECDSGEVITHWKSVLPLPEPPEVEDENT